MKKESESKFQNIHDETIIIKAFEKEVCNKFLNEISTIEDFLGLLNYVNKALYGTSDHIPLKFLTFYAYHNENNYTTFEIAKKSGGKREINAPVKALKNLQKTLAYILSCLFKPSMVTHGFSKNRSIITNAKHHIAQNYVYNIDLEDFFPSIHKARIEKRLQVAPFNLNGEKSQIATLIARLTTLKVFENGKNFAVLPQGSPTSPVLSNIICERLDRRLLGLAKRFNVRYSRYADDMTFSSMHNVYQEDSEFIKELHRIIEEQNFKINPKKTRLQKQGYRQEVTGIIVNEKINVNRRYVKQLRAMIYSIEKFGIEKAQKSFEEHYKRDKGHIKQNIPSILQVVRGKLDYLKMVKGNNDSTYLKLQERFESVTPIKKPKDEKSINKINPKVHNPKELVKLLSSFANSNNSLKYATHDWDMEQLEDKWRNFDKFIRDIGKEWKKISNDLKNLKSKTSAKINNFLFRNDLGEKDDEDRLIVWGEHHIAFGWSSPQLKVWCNEGHDPFKFFLPDEYRKRINGKSIDRFRDIVWLFKNEIEIRTEDKRLKEVFREIKKDILGKDFKLSLDKSLDGVDFYTDVQHFKNGLRKIFQGASTRTQYPQINIKAKKNDKGYVDIYITHIDSFSNKEPKELSQEIENGDFEDIKESFRSLCDWSVQDRYLDESIIVDYLGEISKESFEVEDTIDGFTHILRFYR